VDKVQPGAEKCLPGRRTLTEEGQRAVTLSTPRRAQDFDFEFDRVVLIRFGFGEYVNVVSLRVRELPHCAALQERQRASHHLRS